MIDATKRIQLNIEDINKKRVQEQGVLSNYSGRC